MTLFGGSFLKWSCHIINNGHNNYHHHYIFHKLLSSSMRSLNFFLPSPLCQVSVRVHVCLRMGKKERSGLVVEDALQAGSPGNI